jgi:hypothetical protein
MRNAEGQPTLLEQSRDAQRQCLLVFQSIAHLRIERRNGQSGSPKAERLEGHNLEKTAGRDRPRPTAFAKKYRNLLPNVSS